MKPRSTKALGTLSFRESRLDGIERDLSKVVRFNRRNPSPFEARSTYGTPGDSRDAATGDADERAQSGSMAAGCALRAGHGVLTQGVRVTDDLSVVNEWLAEFDVTMFRGEDGKYRIWGDINRIQDIVDSPRASSLPLGARGDRDEFFADEVDGKWSEIFVRKGFRPVNDPVIGPSENRPDATSEQIDACFKETYDYFRLPPDERQD